MTAPLVEVRGFPRPGGPPLDFTITPGEIVVLRGANGSGKTSLLRCLAGLDSARRPETARVAGKDPAATPAARVPELLALSPQEPRDGLVGLTVAGEFRLRQREAPVELTGLAEREVASLSSGEARRTVLALAGSGAPLLLLDEAGEGLDAAGQARLRALVERQGQHGAVMAVDHQGLLADLATRTIDLTQADGRKPVGSLPAAAPGATRLACDAGTWRHLRLPALALGPGVHAVTGPNGSGKSTFLRRLAGLLPAGRTVSVAGEPPRPGVNVTLLPARARDLLSRDTVAEELAAPDRSADGPAHRLIPGHLLSRHPLTLSGGEAQRVALAKAFAHPARVLLLDEPEAHLDEDGRQGLFELLEAASRAGRCVVAATHDEQLQQAAHTRIRLESGSAP